MSLPHFLLLLHLFLIHSFELIAWFWSLTLLQRLVCTELSTESGGMKGSRSGYRRFESTLRRGEFWLLMLDLLLFEFVLSQLILHVEIFKPEPIVWRLALLNQTPVIVLSRCSSPWPRRLSTIEHSESKCFRCFLPSDGTKFIDHRSVLEVREATRRVLSRVTIGASVFLHVLVQLIVDLEQVLVIEPSQWPIVASTLACLWIPIIILTRTFLQCLFHLCVLLLSFLDPSIDLAYVLEVQIRGLWVDLWLESEVFKVVL